MTIELIKFKIIFREKSNRKCQMHETSLTRVKHEIKHFLGIPIDGKYQGFGKRTTLSWTKLVWVFN